MTYLLIFVGLVLGVLLIDHVINASVRALDRWEDRERRRFAGEMARDCRRELFLRDQDAAIRRWGETRAETRRMVGGRQ